MKTQNPELFVTEREESPTAADLARRHRVQDHFDRTVVSDGILVNGQDHHVLCIGWKTSFLLEIDILNPSRHDRL